MNTENSSSGSVVEEIKMREEIEKVCSLKGAIDKNHTPVPTESNSRSWCGRRDAYPKGFKSITKNEL
jgi:hypothetical protein